jgi:hypothetical protein
VRQAHEQHTLHRLEAFSDIVIAVCISEVAFNLTSVGSSSDLLSHRQYLLGFFIGFVFVATIWWMHSRIFARYFVADTPGIVANFAMLAATILFAVAQQLFYRQGLDPTTVVLYASSGGAVYALIGLLFLRGARNPRLELNVAERASGTWRGLRAVVVGICLLGSLAAVPLGVERVAYCWLLIVPAAAVMRLLELRTRAVAAAG